MLKQLGESRMARLVEMYGWMLLLFLGAVFSIGIFLRYAPNLMVPLAGATVAFLLALIFGTRLMVPVYFLTTFGTVLLIPGAPASLSVNRMAAGLLFLAAVLEVPAVRHRLLLTPPVVLFIAFQLYYIPMAEVLAPERGGGLPVESIFYLLLGTVVALRYWQEQWLRHLLWGILLTSLVMVVVPGVLEVLLQRDLRLDGRIRPLGRVDGFSLNAIVYAFTAVYAMPIAALFAIESRHAVVRLFSVAALASLVIMSLATLNRQTPIIMALVLFTFVVLIRSRYRTLLLVGFVAVGVIAAPIAGQKLLQRFETATDFRKDPSLAIRRDHFLIGKEMLKQNLWTGIGHNHFKHLQQDYRPLGKLFLVKYVIYREHYIDFGWWQILVEYGVIGATIVLMLFASTVFVFGRYYLIARGFPESWWANMMACLGGLYVQQFVSLFIQDTFNTPRSYLLYGMFFAVCTAIELRRRELGSAGE
jgi:O-antigen ligase